MIRTINHIYSFFYVDLSGTQEIQNSLTVEKNVGSLTNLWC